MSYASFTPALSPFSCTGCGPGSGDSRYVSSRGFSGCARRVFSRVPCRLRHCGGPSSAAEPSQRRPRQHPGTGCHRVEPGRQVGLPGGWGSGCIDSRARVARLCRDGALQALIAICPGSYASGVQPTGPSQGTGVQRGAANALQSGPGLAPRCRVSDLESPESAARRPPGAPWTLIPRVGNAAQPQEGGSVGLPLSPGAPAPPSPPRQRQHSLEHRLRSSGGSGCACQPGSLCSRANPIHYLPLPQPTSWPAFTIEPPAPLGMVPAGLGRELASFSHQPGLKQQ